MYSNKENMYLNKVIATKSFEYVYDKGEWIAPVKSNKQIECDPTKTYVLGHINMFTKKIILIDEFVTKFHWENNKCIIDCSNHNDTVDVLYIIDDNMIGYKVLESQPLMFQSLKLLVEYSIHNPQLTQPSWMIEKEKELREKRKEIETRKFI